MSSPPNLSTALASMSLSSHSQQHVSGTAATAPPSPAASESPNKLPLGPLSAFPIFKSILAHCDTCTLFRLLRLSKATRLELQNLLPTLFDIDRFLERWFPVPLAFRLLQERTGSIVSGSSALQFFERIEYKGSDLDVYVMPDKLREVVKFLLSKAAGGYRHEPRENPNGGLFDENLELAISEVEVLHARGRWLSGENQFPGGGGYGDYQTRVFDFVGRKEGRERKVQVIVSKSTLLGSVVGFHSTVVMNAITHTTAYSLYPRSTFRDRVLLDCWNKTLDMDWGYSHHREAIDKYVARGWRELASLDSDQDLEKTDRAIGERVVGDEWTLVVPLLVGGIQQECARQGREMVADDDLFGEVWRMVKVPRWLAGDDAVTMAVPGFENWRETESDDYSEDEEEEEEEWDMQDWGTLLATAANQRDLALAQRDLARTEREAAIEERDAAIAERDEARREVERLGGVVRELQGRVKRLELELAGAGGKRG